MKRNAITRIILFSIIILVLLGILVAGLGIGMFMINLDIDDSDYITSENSSVTVSPDEIRNIEIEWASGAIDILAEDTDTITFSESGTFDEDQQMVWKQSGDTITICYQRPSIQLGFFSYTDKDLTVTVPKDWLCHQITLEVASADVTVERMTADEITIDTASGDIEFLDCTMEELDIDTASGTIHYEGALTTLNCDAASGSFDAIFTNVPSRLQMDSASGDLDITLPADCGFLVAMDAISGKFHSDFPAAYNGDSYEYGDKRCSIEFDGASGNITIRNAG